MRGGRTVEEHRRPQAGAEGEDQLEPSAPDHGEAVHIGVVRKTSRLPEPALELSAERKTSPRFDQLTGQRGSRSGLRGKVGRSEHAARSDEPGESNRDAVPGWELMGELVERG